MPKANGQEEIGEAGGPKNVQSRVEGKRFIISAEHPEESETAKYCLANPDKYPEITS